MQITFVGVETWPTYDPGDEETQGPKGQTPRPSNLQGNPRLNWFKTNVPAKSSKQCQATSTIVQVTSLSLLGDVVSCHKAKCTAMGLNYLTS